MSDVKENEEDNDDDGIAAITDALEQAKRVGEFSHWRAAKLRKRLKKRFADKEAAKIGRISAAPSAIVGVVLSGVLISAVGDIGIKLMAAIIITFVIERTIRKTISEGQETSPEIPVVEKRNQYIIGSSFAGMSSGMLGIGGGAILVTTNRSILKMDAKKAAGTAN